jgi:hypothetical protein
MPMISQEQNVCHTHNDFFCLCYYLKFMVRNILFTREDRIVLTIYAPMI